MKKILMSITLFCLCIALGGCGKADIIKEPALAIAQETEVAVKAEETSYEETEKTTPEVITDMPAAPSIISAPPVPHSNRYFFPEGLSEIEVGCEMNYVAGYEFKGKATLNVNKLPDTRLGNFYELILTDLEGECEEIDPWIIWGDDPEANPDYDPDYHPYFSEDFPIGYFYVTDNEIYYLHHGKMFEKILSEMPMFPPTQEYVDNCKNEDLEFISVVYRVVYTADGSEDTYDPDSGDYDGQFHNFISVEGDEVHYNFYPDNYSTKEHTYMFWKRDQGLAYYGNWVGGGRGYIGFWLPSYGNQRDNVF